MSCCGTHPTQTLDATAFIKAIAVDDLLYVELDRFVSVNVAIDILNKALPHGAYNAFNTERLRECLEDFCDGCGVAQDEAGVDVAPRCNINDLKIKPYRTSSMGVLVQFPNKETVEAFSDWLEETDSDGFSNMALYFVQEFSYGADDFIADLWWD